jgi:probable rRNA maturation factor
VAIEVVNRQRLARLDARRIASLVDATLGAVGRPGANVTVALVRDRDIRKLNRKYRGFDRATDVLSFPSANEPGQHGGEGFIATEASNHLGDIVVSTDTAMRQADDAGHSLEHEVDELVMHGVLHLCGFDHESDRGEMNRLEFKLRRKLLTE